MIAVSAYPTVEWIRSRVVDRSPQSAHLPHNTSGRLLMADRLASRLREVLSAQTTVTNNVWISTPDGEVEVSIVLERNGRRIALCETPRYRSSQDRSDAVTLVYGRFDALYRFKSDESVVALHELVYVLMSDHPMWFSAFGRMSAGRRASGEVLLTGRHGLSDSQEAVVTNSMRMERMRLCIARDWVESFERALSAGNIQSGTDR